MAVSGAGALSKNEINNQTLSHTVDSTISIAGDLKVTAEDTAKIDGLIISASVAAAGGLVGVGVALGLSSVENIIPATALTQARISGGQFTVGGSVTVEASSTGTMNSDVNAVSIGFAAGAVGVAAAVAGVKASHDLSGKVAAQIVGSGNKESSAVSGVTVKASNKIKSDLDVKSASVAATIGGGAAVSLSVSSATTTLKPIVSATISTAQASTGQFSTAKLKSANGDIIVTADNNATVTNAAATASVAASLGGFAITGGGALATVTATPQVNAMVQNSDINAKNVAVSANSTDTIDADSKAAAISLGLVGLGASGSISNVTLEPALKSEVAKTRVASEGMLTIKTEFTPVATAESAGLAVSTGASVEASRSDVMIGGSLMSRLDAGNVNNKPINVGALTIHAHNKAVNADGIGSSAKATGASGGLLVGANGAIAYNTNTTKSTAEIADNTARTPASSAITVKDKTDIRVNSATSQTAEAGSLAVGLLSSGNTLTEAKSDNGATARIGNNVRLTTGNLDLQSISVDNNISTAKLGSFGGIGIALSKGDTTTKSVTKAIIDDGAVLTVSGKLDADANHTSKYNAKMSSLSGGIISGSGGAVNNIIDSTVNVNIGSGTTTSVKAGRMDATATNKVEKNLGTDNDVDAVAGGLIAGVIMKHDTTLTLNTTTTIGNNAKIDLTADDINPSNFEAVQDIKITDKLKFVAGGLAAGGALITNIKSTDHNIGVTVGTGVQIDAKTPLHFAANEKAEVIIQANSDAYGAATATGNKATIDLKPKKSVTIGSNAKVFSTRDVALLAGMTSSPTLDPKNDDYEIKSNVDAFAGSLIPLDIIDSDAHLLQTNTIVVTKDAEVKSGGDILLYADGDDYQPVSAQAKSANWITGLSSIILGAPSDAEGGVGQISGESSTKADASVTVRGTLETGFGRNRTLVIGSLVEPTHTPNPQDPENHARLLESYRVNLSTSKDFDFTEKDLMKEFVTIKSLDETAFSHAEEQLRIPGTSSQLKKYYEDEKRRLEEKMKAEDFLVTVVDERGNVVTVFKVIEQLNRVIPDITASSGAIRIFADQTYRTEGTLTAPSDPSITITNKTYAYLTTSKLTIPDHNGGVFINGHLTAELTTRPKILVENTLTKIDTASGLAWPGINVMGSINNSSGDVTLKNYSAGAGDIKIEAPIHAATQTIVTGLNGTLNISLGSEDSVFEAGGSAYKQILPFTGKPEFCFGIFGCQPATPGNGTLKVGDEPGASNALNGSTSVLRGARIILKAASINLNGLIESGRTDFTLVITEAMHIQAGELNTGIHELTTNENGAFTVEFDADKKEYVVSDFAPVGGNVEIHGQIASTGGGKIQVASGYASLKIESQRDDNFPIRLKNIDLSNRADGRLVINDSSKPNESTIYESHGDYIYKNSTERYELTSDHTYQPEMGLRYGFTIVEDDKKVTTEFHSNSSGFLGIDAFSKDAKSKVREVTTPIGPPRLSASGVYFYKDLSNQDFSYDRTTTTTGSETSDIYNASSTGWWLVGYTNTWQFDITEGLTSIHSHSMRADRPINIHFTGLKEPKLDVVWAGNVIVDGKIGDDRGVTNVSASNLTTTDRGLVKGRQIKLTANQLGTPATPGTPAIPGTPATPVRTDLADRVAFDYLSNEQVTPRKIYHGQRVLVAANHTKGGVPGTVYVYRGELPSTKALSEVDYNEVVSNKVDSTNTRLWEPVVNDVKMKIESKVGETNIHEVSGDLVIGQIDTRGNTWLRAAGGIQSAVDGGSIKTDPSNFSKTLTVLSLIADSGDIGSEKAPINILTTWQASFSATTPGNVFLHSQKDLAVNQIHAGGDVVINFAPGFSMIDVDFIDLIDERAIGVLRTTVWDDLQLTSKPNDPHGFENKLASRIADLEASNTSEYRTYWDLRLSEPDSYQLDRVTLTTAEKEARTLTLRTQGMDAGLSGGDLDTYVNDNLQKIEEQRTAWHTKWRGTEFNPNFKYTATDAEKTQIKDSMHLWTEAQLQDLRSPSFARSFLEITDTELVIEQPNIVAKSVTIKDAYGIGSYDHGQTIELKDTNGNRPKLNLDQRAAVVAAETGDLIFTTQAPVAVVVSVEDGYKLKLEGTTKNPDAPYGDKSSTWTGLGFQVGQSIMLAGDPGSTTDRGVFYTVKSIDDKILEVDAVMTDKTKASPVKTRKIGSDNFLPKEFGEYLIAPVSTHVQHTDATHLHVLRREDVDFHSAGKIEINATNHIFVGSEHAMVLGNIKGSGTIQIKANGDLTRSSSSSDAPEIRGNVVLLESANGKIGTTEERLRIGKQDKTILRAKDDIHAESSDNSNSPLQIKNVYSSIGVVDLQFPGGFVDLCIADVAIRAANIRLATDDSLGDISGVSCPFTIGGTTNAGTTINAVGKNINITSKGNSTVGKKAVSAAGGEGETRPEIEGLFATGNLRLESLGSLTILGTMSAGGEMFVSATGQFIAIPESRVLSNGPVTLVLHTLPGSSSPGKLDFLGELIAPTTVVHGSDGPNEFRFAPAASSSGEVQLTLDKLDSMDYCTNWTARRPTVQDGQFFHVLSNGAQKLHVKGGVRNTNPILPSDVNADGRVDPLDVLVVINLLNRSSRPDWLSSDGPMSSEELLSFAYYDVNADGSVDPLDVLTIINLLNNPQGNSEGEFVGNAEGGFVANPAVASTSFTQFANGSYGHDHFQGGRGNYPLVGRSSKAKQQGEGSQDQLLGRSTEYRDDLTSLDAALADWSGSDWSLATVDLGEAINDDDKDDVWGDKGIDIDLWLTADNLQR